VGCCLFNQSASDRRGRLRAFRNVCDKSRRGSGHSFDDTALQDLLAVKRFLKKGLAISQRSVSLFGMKISKADPNDLVNRRTLRAKRAYHRSPSRQSYRKFIHLLEESIARSLKHDTGI
jgi:hypothetical protein